MKKLFTLLALSIVLFACSSDDDEVIPVGPEKELTLTSLYILSEGYWNADNSELAHYEIETDSLTKKSFYELNKTILGDTGNDLAIYGSKMYCVVSGSNTTKGGHIEVINPHTGISIKRIKIEDDQPRKIEFYNGKAYISSYEGFVLRMDTASLSIENKTKLSGTYPEGICQYNGKLYVCNSGQGSGTTISVVDISSFKEIKTIDVPKNPMAIKASPTGELFFTTATLSWSTGEPSNLHILNAQTETVTKTFDIRASALDIDNNYIYTVDNETNWTTFESIDYNYKINLKTHEVSTFTEELPNTFMVYNVSANKNNGDVYMTGQGQDVAIFDKDGKLKKKLKTGSPMGNRVVPVYEWK